jgi:hypothetical protein
VVVGLKFDAPLSSLLAPAGCLGHAADAMRLRHSIAEFTLCVAINSHHMTVHMEFAIAKAHLGFDRCKCRRAPGPLNGDRLWPLRPHWSLGAHPLPAFL